MLMSSCYSLYSVSRAYDDILNANCTWMEYKSLILCPQGHRKANWYWTESQSFSRSQVSEHVMSWMSQCLSSLFFFLHLNIWKLEHLKITLSVFYFPLILVGILPRRYSLQLLWGWDFTETQMLRQLVRLWFSKEPSRLCVHICAYVCTWIPSYLINMTKTWTVYKNFISLISFVPYLSKNIPGHPSVTCKIITLNKL